MVFETVTSIPKDAEYDFVIVGGGTAGCVIASRLAEYLPHKKTLLIEAGPSDFMDDRVLLLKYWLNLLGGELDWKLRQATGVAKAPMVAEYVRHVIHERGVDLDLQTNNGTQDKLRADVFIVGTRLAF